MVEQHGLQNCDSGLGGIFRVGRGEVRSVCATADGKIEFVAYADQTLCCITNCNGQRAAYPLDAVEFVAPAEYVVMDLDGTSIMSEEFWVSIIEQTVSRLIGRQVLFAQEDIPFVSGHTTNEHLDYALQKYAHRPLSDFAQAMEVYHEISRRELGSLVSGVHNDKMRPVDGLKDFLLALKSRGVKIGLGSSGLFYKAIPEIDAAFRVMGLGDPRDFYDCIIMGGVEKQKGNFATLGEMSAKPHPWLYKEIACMGLGCTRPEKLAVIEDSGSGVLAARLAGYPVIGMTAGNITASGLSDLCFVRAAHLREVENIIFGG